MLLDEKVWQDRKRSSEINKQIAIFERKISSFEAFKKQLDEISAMWDLACEEKDAELLICTARDIQDIQKKIETFEFEQMFTNELDTNNAFLEIQAGSGGTEAQDWAEMLARMYFRWAEAKGFKVQTLHWAEGEVAGIKGATFKLCGEYAYGWSRTETGIHRLVRKSPFDSGNRRHTSFAAVFISAEIDENIEVEIINSDLRIDTYRSSGAGGQHVNTTDSAVRITHLPSNIVVQCQSERSQHQNKAKALVQLRSKLYEKQLNEKIQDQEALAKSKDDITWGRQIRSYVLDQSRVKDVRTGVESSNPQAVLDGELDRFISTSLKQGV